ncbi:2Fe-2S iron-sulfur cluster-binding protein [Paracoccus aerodenitrificans]|uniref:2Fe-2S iron-sulfur cluster-binding protein n=1 Tax=Paracoccus aerodenitrificans TaxID=3017781 RepID=UPI0022F0B139|nr:2Fe-2S iron-sulfur cluster-binding protein [Paracoccus aerodenitrificans]WBU63570.1 2Fe-2S iron-sulfur cluster-binding protein [Paracoccus aerodenitrificans]
MVNITFVETDGTERNVEAEVGLSIMEVATRNNVAGIIAECGGQCSCATCHVYIEGAFFDKVGEPVDDEEDMLDFSENRKENSRLGCQIEVTDDLDGMTVRVAEEE